MDNEIRIIDNFITKEQENEILKLVPIKNHSGKNERNQILRYGSFLPYRMQNVSETIPKIFKTLNIPVEFNSVTINEYFRGQSIDYHYDLPNSGNVITVLSLHSIADLIFKNYKGETKCYTLKPLSLTTISGKLRWWYKHSCLAYDRRYSVVFRNSDEKPEANQICQKCDSYIVKSKCYCNE